MQAMGNERRFRHAKQNSKDVSSVPVPVFSAAGKRKRSSREHTDYELARRSLQTAFKQRLRSDITTTIKSAVTKDNKSESKRKTSSVDSQLAKLKMKLLEAKRMPRNIYEQADDMAGVDAGATYTTLHTKRLTNSNHDLDDWNGYVVTNWETIVDEVKSSISDDTY